MNDDCRNSVTQNGQLKQHNFEGFLQRMSVHNPLEPGAKFKFKFKGVLVIESDCTPVPGSNSARTPGGMGEASGIETPKQRST
jgi:hypothetical protein